MKLTLFGATGSSGSRILTEAVRRGHEVTAVGRTQPASGELPAGVTFRTGDASNAEQVAALCEGRDALIGATRPAPGRERDLLAATAGLLEGAARAGVRLVLVGGAGSLVVPGTSGWLAVDDETWVPAEWRPIAQACVEQLQLCRQQLETDWTYVSPPALLVPGTRTGAYRLGRDELLVDPRGASQISLEDFAVAVLDEIERPRHRGTRFTVASV